MSMSERRTKHKYNLSINSHIETQWSTDKSKFGQKMLERMGWKVGQGLGKNEDGMSSNVKVRFKNDTQGLGFNEYEQGSVQQDDYNDLLKKLNQNLGKNSNEEAPVKIRSLEELSKTTRSKVHYKKFTRGKDLSRCSIKDLTAIFGKKITGSIVQEIEPREDYKNVEVYKKKNKRKLEKESYAFNNPTLEPTDVFEEPQIVNDVYEVKPKKKMKKNNGLDNPALNLDSSNETDSRQETSEMSENFSNVSENSQNFEVIRKKKKKKSKERLGIDNPVLNDSLVLTNLSVITISHGDKKEEILKSVLTPPQGKKRKRTKSVRFSEINQEFIIPNVLAEYTEEYVENRKELFEINDAVIQNSLIEEQQNKSCSNGILNKAFDIRHSYKDILARNNALELPLTNANGIDNVGYDVRKQFVDEAVNTISATLDQYQAEVENTMNEKKAKKKKKNSKTPEK